MLDGFAGSVFSDQLHLGEDSVPLVILIAGPASDPHRLREDFFNACVRTFPPETWIRHGAPEEAARRCRLFAEGHTDRQIAAMELAELHVLDAEYKEELRLRTNEVKVGRKRWRDYVTKIVDSV